MELPAQIGYSMQREYNGWVVVELPRKVLKGTDESFFRQQILELTKIHIHIALDMSKTEFVDSSIVALLLSTDKTLTEKKGKLAILAPNNQAIDLFAVTSIDKIIKIVSNDNELRFL
jgi:anti-anti-sigma factor